MLFHHDPYHTDADLEALLDAARRTIDAPDDWVRLAYEGMSVDARRDRRLLRRTRVDEGERHMPCEGPTDATSLTRSRGVALVVR